MEYMPGVSPTGDTAPLLHNNTIIITLSSASDADEVPTLPNNVKTSTSGAKKAICCTTLCCSRSFLPQGVTVSFYLALTTSVLSLFLCFKQSLCRETSR